MQRHIYVGLDLDKFDVHGNTIPLVGALETRRYASISYV